LPSLTFGAIVARLCDFTLAVDQDHPDSCPGAKCAHDDAASDDVGLLQQRAHSDVTSHVHSEVGVWALEEEPDFREPPVVRSPVTLNMMTMKLCLPDSKVRKKYSQADCWYTRAYGTNKLPASIPGPTIRVKPGETLKVTMVNQLRYPSPGCDPLNLGFCDANTTNLHTHGLHVSARGNQDSVFEHIKPGGWKKYAFEVVPYHMGGTHWYHPHSHHAAAIQAGGGAHGALIVDDVPGSLPPEIEGMEEKIMVMSLVDSAWKAHTNGVYGMSRLESMAKSNLWKTQKGKYLDVDDVAVLVNGQFKPKLKIVNGKWYRLRMVFAAVELVLGVFPFFGTSASCDFQLLAKDGIYLHEMPRTVKRIFFASGNRVDVALRCTCTNRMQECSSHLVTASHQPSTKMKEIRQKTENELQKERHFQKSPLSIFGKKSRREGGLHSENEGPLKGIDEKVVEQDLLLLDISASPNGPEPDLRSFKINRPCYLVDLRSVKVPRRNQGRIELMNPIDFRIRYATQLTGGQAAGHQMKTMKEGPLGTLKVGQVYEWSIRGPPGRANDNHGLSIHPFHMHVNPFQVVSLESWNDFYRAGDWHDTLLHGSGHALVKTQTNTFTGHAIFHCHLLDHEDMGMMGYFDIKGREGSYWKDAKKVDPTCYRDQSGVGFTYLKKGGGLLEVQPRWVTGAPGENCHIACGDLGGCAAGLRPSTRHELDAVLRQTGISCSNITASTALHAPSVVQGGACSFFSGHGTAADFEEEYHCGVDPPADASRFCQCQGI